MKGFASAKALAPTAATDPEDILADQAKARHFREFEAVRGHQDDIEAMIIDCLDEPVAPESDGD